MSALLKFLRAPIGWAAGAALLLVLQTAALAWMIADRALLLRDGVEVVLRPTPVDPRDLFRGDYVILRYPFAAPSTEARPAQGATVWAVLTPNGDGAWRLRDMTTAEPSEIDDQDVLLRGRFEGARAVFGIERFYVPQGEGLRLERLIGEGRLEVVVAVDDNGRAAIKRLLVDGAAVYEEPPF